MLIQEIHGEVSIDSLFRCYAKEPGVSFLDSSLCAYGIGDYSILCCHPWKEISFDDGIATIQEGKMKREIRGDPFAILESESMNTQEKSVLPFFGGAIGYLGYDVGRYYEKVPNIAKKTVSGYEMRFRFYDAGICIDHTAQKVFAFASERSSEAAELLDEQIALVEKSRTLGEKGAFGVGKLTSNFTLDKYLAAVEEIRNRIREGEVYQVNLSQRFSGKFRGAASSLYERLRNVSPSPYGAYLDFGDEVILSSSPEQLLKSDKRRLVTRPIKGTRPRGVDPAKDEKMKQSLMNSEKDRSELLMIVDLERNDLGRVCEPGSIRVEDLFDVEAYSNVFHQTASVLGNRAEPFSNIDSLKALFPGGSITGAPKIKAMEVIDELEPDRRGVYTGGIGYIGYNGEVHFNIAIRTMSIVGDSLYYHVGGGVVWDSDPQAEYNETLDKGRSIMKAISSGEIEL